MVLRTCYRPPWASPEELSSSWAGGEDASPSCGRPWCRSYLSPTCCPRRHLYWPSWYKTERHNDCDRSNTVYSIWQRATFAARARAAAGCGENHQYSPECRKRSAAHGRRKYVVKAVVWEACVYQGDWAVLFLIRCWDTPAWTRETGIRTPVQLYRKKKIVWEPNTNAIILTANVRARHVLTPRTEGPIWNQAHLGVSLLLLSDLR